MALLKRILLSGYYGFSNAGDEAVLAAIIAGLKSQFGDTVEISVLSSNCEYTEKLHCVTAVPRGFGGIRAAVRSCDLLISGGGSLIQDATSLRSLAYYLEVIREAKSCGCKVMILGQGIGPLRRGISRHLCRWVLNGVDLITVRDADSANLLNEIRVTKPPVHVTADPTFALNPCPEEETFDLLASVGIGAGEDFVAVSLRNWPESPAVEGIAIDALKQLVDRIPAKVLLIAMHIPEDMQLAERVHGAVRHTLIQSSPWSPRQIRGVLGKSNLVVGMRLHSLILAASAGVPCVGLSYDPKVESFLATVHQDNIRLNEMTRDVLIDRVLNAWKDREALESRLSDAVPQLTESASENFRLAAELLS